MNAIRKMMTSEEVNKNSASKTNLTLVNNENRDDKKKAEKMSKDYLNEKLYYFYTNGGPVMDI